jgi:hypothetical protein
MSHVQPDVVVDAATGTASLIEVNTDGYRRIASHVAWHSVA